MILRILIKLFGVNYQTSVAGIFAAISAVPAGVTLMQTLYGSTIFFPTWVTGVAVACAFISYIYGAVMQKSKGVTGSNGTAKLLDNGELKTKKEILNGK